MANKSGSLDEMNKFIGSMAAKIDSKINRKPE